MMQPRIVQTPRIDTRQSMVFVCLADMTSWRFMYENICMMLIALHKLDASSHISGVNGYNTLHSASTFTETMKTINCTMASTNAGQAVKMNLMYICVSVADFEMIGS